MKNAVYTSWFQNTIFKKKREVERKVKIEPSPDEATSGLTKMRTKKSATRPLQASESMVSDKRL